MSIYKPCDIRGHVPTDLVPQMYESWGRALGQQVPAKSQFVVGGDVRGSTGPFLDALVEGLRKAGVEAINLGILPTPMIYYARRRLRAAACAIVTASHNPPDFNGLKWMLGDDPPCPEQSEMLRGETECPSRMTDERESGGQRKVDISGDYLSWLQETWQDARTFDARIVLDPMHGTWAGRARQYLQAVFPRALFSAVHDTPDALFCGQDPDCSRPDRLRHLCETVDRERADFGIAFDGDGDRVAFVDDQGIPLTAEETTWAFLQSFGLGLEGEPFVHDLKFSDHIARVARELGGTPLVERTGHAFIRNRMLDSGAVFGAEVSGHYFFRALEGGDDGMFAACWLIDYLAQCGRPLSELRAACPNVCMTPDLRLPVDSHERDTVIDRVRQSWPDYPRTTVDGIRVDFPAGWALIRGSVTEQALTFRFEADDHAGLWKLVWQFCDALSDLGDALWAQFEASMSEEYTFRNIGS